MNEEQFISWLDWVLSHSSQVGTETTELIKTNLSTVFNKVTPNYLDTDFYKFGNVMKGEYPTGCGTNTYGPDATESRPFPVQYITC